MREVRGDAPALRILTGRDRRTRRRTDRGVYIKLLEANPLSRQPINLRRLRILVTKTGKIPPTHIVYENEDDIRLSR